jgi:hypothetical protein
MGLLLVRSPDLPASVFRRIGFIRFLDREESGVIFGEMCFPTIDLPPDAYLRRAEDGRYVFKIV